MQPRPISRRIPFLTHAGYNNYEYTSYGAGGGAGGGFIQGDGSQQSPGGRREHTQDSLRPVTIKQILEAQVDASNKDEFKIDGAVVAQVRALCASPGLPLC